MMKWFTFGLLVLFVLSLLPQIPVFSQEEPPRIFLPLVAARPAAQASPTPPPTASPPPPADPITPTIHLPYFEQDIRLAETAIFWFGQVIGTENYADVRLGYSADDLYVRVAAFDQYLWYKKNPAPEELTDWDAVSLFLNADAHSYRFTGQLVWWEERAAYQAAYAKNGAAWESAAIPFITNSTYRGDTPNNMDSDRGWYIIFRIPFASLGRSSPPAQGAQWKLGVVLHDRDSADETSRSEKSWPAGFDAQAEATWGRLSFGLPAQTRPQVAAEGTLTIRQGLDGAVVPDAMVGGSSNCGSDFGFWKQWGNGNYPGSTFANVQNQADVADWPCFSKYYLTFPLDELPAGQAVLSATLELHQMGNAGGGQWGPSPSSLIQVMTVGEDWDEASLSWNNAPLMMENVSQAWVDPIAEWPGWPGVPWQWDLTRAVAQAVQAGQPLRLVLYSADTEYNSGKYFVTSDAQDWNAAARPTLRVTWGQPGD